MDENIKKECEQQIENDMGIVKISDEVVGVIAGLAASEIKGIIGMSDGIVSGFTQMFSKKNPSKGVKVNVGENSATVDLYVLVEYGIKIPEVAKQVQENVKKAVETMTGLNVSAVNVSIQNIVFPKTEVELEDIEEDK